MKLSVHDFLGMIGVACILLMYLLLQLNKVKSTALSYSIINGIGAALIIVSLLFEFNLSAFIIESFWLLISIYGIIKYFVLR
ncbi:MAG: hypothetical protein P8X42_17500 [Calditrichaceae bacterium]